MGGINDDEFFFTLCCGQTKRGKKKLANLSRMCTISNEITDSEEAVFKHAITKCNAKPLGMRQLCFFSEYVRLTKLKKKFLFLSRAIAVLFSIYLCVGSSSR